MSLYDLGKTPIEGSDEAGQDIRVNDIYEELSNEIKKRTALSSESVAIDWAKVVTISQNILANNSKDILVCSYLCVGLLETQGLKGFALGVHIYNDLLNIYWATLYPRRINGKLQAIDWLVDNANQLLRKVERETWEQKEFVRLKEDYDELIEFLRQNEVDKANEIAVMQNLNLSLIDVIIPEVEEEIQVVADASHSATSSGDQSSATSANTIATLAIEQINAANVDTYLSKINTELSKITPYLVKEKTFSYLLYKVNRFIAWANIKELPKSDDSGKTDIVSPNQGFAARIQKLYKEKNWFELLKAAESKVYEHPYCLDLSFYVYKSLSYLNHPFVAREVKNEVLSFIRRLKGIEKLSFKDDTPFANSDTRDWIGYLEVEKNIEANYTKISLEDELNKAYKEAKELYKNGELSSALDKLHSKIKFSANNREKFIRLTNFCKFLHEIEQVDLAKLYLDELSETVTKYNLDDWEPALVSQANQIILKMATQVNLSEELKTKLLTQLRRIDPAASLNLNI